MSWKPIVFALVFFAGVLPRTTQGAEPASGQRVRVTLTGGKRVVGNLIGLDDEAVKLMMDQQATKEVRLQRVDIAKLEVSQHRSTRGKWIGLGLLAGAAIGGAIGAATEQDCGPAPQGEGEDLLGGFGYTLCRNLRGTSTAAGAILGAAAGSLLGLGVSHGERWQATPLESIRVAGGRQSGALGLSISFRF